MIHVHRHRPLISGGRLARLAAPLLFPAAVASALAQSASPAITSFFASPSTVTAGQSASLQWTVSGATSLSIDQGIGPVDAGSVTVTPADTTIYTLTATGPGGVSTATAGLAVGESAYIYLDAYTDALVDQWRIANWGNFPTNTAAIAPGRSGTAIEVDMNAGWLGFSLADIGDYWSNVTHHNFSDTKTLEFDVYFPGSADAEILDFLLEDPGKHNPAKLVDFIPGWSLMSQAERYGHWHHIVIRLTDLQPTISSFSRFILFNPSNDARPHFFIDEIRLGTITDVLPPAITPGVSSVDFDQLTIPFTTDEAATFRIDYGHGVYDHTLDGPALIATNHLAALPGLTRGATLQYRITATDPSGNQGVLTGSLPIIDPPPPTVASVLIHVDPAATRPISPWIYGANFYQSFESFIRNLTFNRHGGNRWTAYNWENNASNAGNDYNFQNDSYLSESNVPGEALRPLIGANRARGNATLFTVPLLGYVAADKNGDNVTNVTPLATRLATRFKQLIYKKPIATAGPFTLTPPPDDDCVYADEFVWALDQLVPGGIFTDPVTPTFISLDNEPDLWSSTHAEITPALPEPDAFIASSIALARAVKDVAPNAKIFGPALFGMSGINSWQVHPSFSASHWFADQYLADFAAASAADGRRLLDVFDIHWYPEATVNNTRVTTLEAETLTDDQIQAIVQCPRSLWDPTYRETSWIADWFGETILLIPRLQARIATHSPGTELAITEWNNGGRLHIAGAISVADTLGIYGQQGIFAANYWSLRLPVTAADFDIAGFKMYRDYDNALGTFGDISIAATSSDTSKVSAYLSSSSTDPERRVIVAINRSNTSQAMGFTGLELVGRARLFRLGRSSHNPKPVGDTVVDLTRWLVDLPTYSITTIELTGVVPAHTYAAWRLLQFTGTDLASDAISGHSADPDGAGMENYARYAFGLPARGLVTPPATAGVADSGQRLSIAFTRRATGTDLSYIVEGSSDLEHWDAVTTLAPGEPTDVTVLDNIALSAGGPRRFLRVRVVSTP